MLLKPKPHGPVILIADDDPSMRGFETHVLEHAGFTVRQAMDVRQACTLLAQPGVSAAVIDMLFVNSDGQSGLDILKSIRSNPQTQNIPVLVLTGFNLNHRVADEVRAMGGELWQKPVDADFLVQRLQVLINEPAIGS
jgi:CheY-like chemotaxis protein